MDAEVEAAPLGGREFEIELGLLIDAIYHLYHYDFRGYAPASLRRRPEDGHDPARLRNVVAASGQGHARSGDISAAVGFPHRAGQRDVPRSAYFRALREKVVPLLRTYPSLKVWVAGCSAGEEAYSLAILLREEGLLAKTLIYATDINPQTLIKAAAGVYEVDRVAGFTANHHRSGARSSLSNYYTAAYGTPSSTNP